VAPAKLFVFHTYESNAQKVRQRARYSSRFADRGMACKIFYSGKNS
jgi:hypothetical protein